MYIKKTNSNSRGIASLLVLVAVVGLLAMAGFIVYSSFSGNSMSDEAQRVTNYVAPTEVPVSQLDDVDTLENELNTTSFDDSELDAELQDLEKELENL